MRSEAHFTGVAPADGIGVQNIMKVTAIIQAEAGGYKSVVCEEDAYLLERPHNPTGYSAHADQNMLVNWVRSMPTLPGEIRLVHGEPKARKALSRALGL